MIAPFHRQFPTVTAWKCRYHSFFLVYCQIALVSVAQAQVIDIAWTFDLPSDRPEQLADLTRTRNERLAIVTKAENASGQQGRFRILDWANGKPSVRQTEPLEGVPASVAAVADDDTYYVVGQIGTKKEQRRAWAVHLDENGKRVKGGDTVVQQAGSQFVKVAWLPSGSAMIAGFHQEKGILTLTKATGNNYTPAGSCGAGQIEKVVRMFARPYTSDQLWLLGQTRKKGSVPAGDAYAALLDQEGVLQTDYTLGSRQEEEIVDGISMYDDSLLLTGRRWQAAGAFPWYGKQAGKSGNTAFSENFGETVEAVAPAGMDGEALFLLRSTRNGAPLYQLAWYGSDCQSADTLAKYNFPKPPSDFGDARLLAIPPNFFVIAGTVRDTISGKTKVRLQGIRLSETGKGRRKSSSLGKGGGTNEYKLEITNLKWDRELKAGANQAILRYEVRNVGTGSLSVGGVVNMVLQDPVTGLKLKGYSQTFDPLHAGKPAFLSANFSIGPDLVTGVSTLDIRVSVQGQEKAARKEKVYSQGQNAALTARGAGTTVAIYQETRSLAVNGDKITIKGVIQQTPDGKIDPYAVQRTENGKLLPRGKENDAAFRLADRKLGQINQSEFSWTAQLKPGRNVFCIEYDGQRDSLVYEYYDKPNLHVLSIGVDYSQNQSVNPLKWVKNDARVFAETMRRQAGSGLIQDVFVDLLDTVNVTKAEAIRKAFEYLQNNRDANGRPKKSPIRPFDYVVIFVSAHGDTSVASRQAAHDPHFWILGSDYEDGLLQGKVDYTDMANKYLKDFNCHKLLFFDACHSGAGKGNDVTEGAAATLALQAALNSTPQRMAFSSSTAGQKSHEIDTPDAEKRFGRHGIFTYALLEAIAGKTVTLKDGKLLKADIDGNNMLTPEELKIFMEKRIPDLSGQTGKPVQNPVANFSTDAPANFSIFTVKN